MEGTGRIMERSGMTWRKSSYSGNGGGNCTEVAAAAGVVQVRDSKDKNGAKLTFTTATWTAFTNQVKFS
jgi:hypothetical protein